MPISSDCEITKADQIEVNMNSDDPKMPGPGFDLKTVYFTITPTSPEQDCRDQLELLLPPTVFRNSPSPFQASVKYPPGEHEANQADESMRWYDVSIVDAKTPR